MSDAIKSNLNKSNVLNTSPSSASPFAPERRNEKVDAVAKLYEKQFLREMMKAMRATVPRGSADPMSMSEGIYREQLDNEYVESWSDNGGVGLSDLIYNQIMEKYFNKIDTSQLRRQGPIQLSARDIARASVVRPAHEQSAPSSTNRQIPIKVELADTSSGPGTTKNNNYLLSPWTASVQSVGRAGDQAHVSLLHPGGLQSSFVFDGVLVSDLTPGQKIEKGQAFGVLGPDASSFHWNLRP